MMAAGGGLPPGELARRLQQALPQVREWIATTLADHQGRALPVNRMGYTRIARLFPKALLERAGAVTVAGDVPFPPLSRMGLPELATFETMPIAGVTYRDIFFVRRGHLRESLCCHELVHVVQWDRLGVDRFLLAYGIGLLQQGYRESPLEAMAYRVQDEFDRGLLSTRLMTRIRCETDAVWQAAALVEKSV
jgi:hypothetical protein